MRDSEFYSEISHITFRRDGIDLTVPAFCYDIQTFRGHSDACRRELSGSIHQLRLR